MSWLLVPDLAAKITPLVKVKKMVLLHKTYTQKTLTYKAYRQTNIVLIALKNCKKAMRFLTCLFLRYALSMVFMILASIVFFYQYLELHKRGCIKVHVHIFWCLFHNGSRPRTNFPPTKVHFRNRAPQEIEISYFFYQKIEIKRVVAKAKFWCFFLFYLASTPLCAQKALILL